jgi:regulator of nucleoside diphosphate kinase
MNTTLPALILSVRDVRRLEALLASPRGEASSVAAALEAELLRGDVREPDQLPSDVVTMNSEVVCLDETSGSERRLQLVYPDAAEAGTGKVSILAPVGVALLGLRVGQSIEWPLPGGRSTRLQVKAVLYQPEAAGHQE